jgi:hypothetical protein
MKAQIVTFQILDPPTVESLVFSHLFDIMSNGTHEMRLLAASTAMELFSAGQLHELSKGLSIVNKQEEGE